MTTIQELWFIAKERGLEGYYKLRKAELEQLLDLPAQKRLSTPDETVSTPQPTSWNV